MDMSPTYVGYKFRSLALANCPTNSQFIGQWGASSKMLLIFLNHQGARGLCRAKAKNRLDSSISFLLE